MKWLFKNENEDSSIKYKENHSNRKKIAVGLGGPGFTRMNLPMIYCSLIFLLLIKVRFNYLLSIKEISGSYMLSASGEITIKIQGSGEQFIMSEDTGLYPHEIYLNSEPTNLQNGTIKKINIPEGTANNTVKLKFNWSIGSLFKIFSGLTNLVEADFTKFDSSTVTNMQSMFYGSKFIKSVNLSNLNTSSVTLMDHMFYNCSSLIWVDLSNFDTKNVQNMASMFYNCYELSSLDLSTFNTLLVDNMDNMFYHCTSLTSLDLSNFYTPLLTSMNYIFESCISLTFLDVSNFNIENVTSMNMSFFDLEKLESLDLSNFSGNKVTNMELLFFKCYKLKYLNLKNFKTNFANNMESMFAHCSSLTSLDVSSFDTSLVTSMKSMFYNCTKLLRLNLSNFASSSLTNAEEMFQFSGSIEYINFPEYNELSMTSSNNILYGVRENIIVCVKNSNSISYLTSMINSKACARIDCSDNWKDNQKKIIAENGTCVDDCLSFNYEFYGVCYTTCPKDEDICQPKSTEIIATTNINNNNVIETTIINNNSSENNDQIKIIYVPGDNNVEIYQEIVKNVISNYDTQNVLLIEAKDNYSYHITTTDNEKDSLNDKNTTHRLSKIDLGECENLLKNHYHIEKTESLIIMKYEKITSISSERSLQYEVYEPNNRTKLNLSICDNTTIDLYVPIVLSEKLENLYNDMKDQGYDLFNIDDPFYQDICTPYKSPNGTDVSLSDRVNYYYNNGETLCQSNCKFSNYSMETQLLKCECDVSNSEIDSKEIKKFTPKSIYESFYETLKFSNYKVLKCHNLAFSIKSLTSNKGGIIAIVYFGLFLISLIFYYVKGLKQLQNDFELNITKDKNLPNDELLKENIKENTEKKDPIVISYNQNSTKNSKKSRRKRKRKTEVIKNEGINKFNENFSSKKGLNEKKNLYNLIQRA